MSFDGDDSRIEWLFVSDDDYGGRWITNMSSFWQVFLLVFLVRKG